MSPRKRRALNSHLPDYLYRRKKNGKWYFAYQHYSMSKEEPFGTNEEEAIRDARELNIALSGNDSLRVHNILNPEGGATVKEVATQFRSEMIDADPELAERTKREKGYKISKIVREIGSRIASQIKTKDIVAFLSTLKGDAYRQHRIVLKQLFDYAISVGEVEAGKNPVTATQARIKGVTKSRKPLSIEGYNLIRAEAPPWFQVAMDFMLVFGLAVNEAAKAKHSDEDSGRFRIERDKTIKYDTSRSALEITPLARDVLNRAKALPPLSQYVLPNGRGQKRNSETLTRAFKRYRDKVPMFLSMPDDERPTTHCIRGLASRVLLEIEKIEIKEIQKTLTHASEKQTRVYTDNPDAPKEYIPAVAVNTKIWRD